MGEPFYVGYLPLPKGLRPVVVGAVVMGVLGLPLLAGVLAVSQRATGLGSWDLATAVTLEGTIHERPYPAIEVDGELVPLIEEAKIGAQHRVEGFEGRAASAQGTVIERGGRRMLALILDREAIEVGGGALSSVLLPRALGHAIEIEGEIIDPKCYLGAMKPGDGKAHKACAALCIMGGVPPMLVVGPLENPSEVYVLVSADGSPMRGDAARRAGERVVVRGRVGDWGDWPMLFVEAFEGG